jgi:carboxypeptidase family protein
MISVFVCGREMPPKKTAGSSPSEHWRARVSVLVLVLFYVSVASAQQPFGIIVGTVTDPAGATLPAATVTVTNTETQVSQTVVTSATGDYSVPYLANGTYTITAERTGFRVAVMSRVVVRAAQTVRADIRMQVGEVKEVVIRDLLFT